jgi:hypothetical protein
VAPQDEVEPYGKPAGTIGIHRFSSRPGIGSRLALWHFATALDSEGYYIAFKATNYSHEARNDFHPSIGKANGRVAQPRLCKRRCSPAFTHRGYGRPGSGLCSYAQTGSSWVLFAVLFLAPDLSFLAYYGGAAAGTFVYNSFHTYVVPLALLTAGLVFYPEIIPYTFIWIAHLGFDRALGYGLKYPSAFGHTHLGLVGKAGPA